MSPLQTSEINHGTIVERDFTAARLILKIPFLHLLHSIERVRPLHLCGFLSPDFPATSCDKINPIFVPLRPP